MEKGFVCNSLPNFSIGSGPAEIRFKGGLFVTSDPEQIARLEAHAYYGGIIQPRDGTPVPEGARELVQDSRKAVVGPEEITVPGVEAGGVHQGARGSKFLR